MTSFLFLIDTCSKQNEFNNSLFNFHLILTLLFDTDVSADSALQQGLRVKASMRAPGRAVLGCRRLPVDQYSQHVYRQHPPSHHPAAPLFLSTMKNL